jgi:hypothetical protein
MMELYLHSPISLHGVVFNLLSAGTTLPLLTIVLIEKLWKTILRPTCNYILPFSPFSHFLSFAAS